jgi:hypothetical protein
VKRIPRLRLPRLRRLEAPARAGPVADDWLTKYGTALAVLVVAAIAAVVSFVHIRELAATHGQTSLAANLLPFSIDGTVAASALAMLRAARLGHPTPHLARFMLALAVLATLGANVLYGLPFGVVGAMVSGWPAVAFIGCTEVAVSMARKTAAKVRAADLGDTVSAASWTDAESAAREALARTLAAGNPLSANQLTTQFRLTRAEVTKVRQAVLAESNGHSPQ